MKEAEEAFQKSGSSKPFDPALVNLIIKKYTWSKYFRVDNCLDNAKYLGYLNARDLYPDFKPVTFRDFVRDELLQGKSVKPYPQLQLATDM